MNTKFVKSVLWLCLAFLAFSRSIYALEVETHTAINEKIAKETMNGFSLDSYLKTNIGIGGGVNEIFKDKDNKANEVYKWLKLGGEYEDIPAWYLQYVRSLNHFHNPITEEGFRGDCLQSSLCVSSTVWALMPLGTQSSITGNYSWYDVRDYYYKALISSDKTTRDTYFSETLRGIGQLMHLIEDASVPAHTRNDFHYFYNYEDWVASPSNVNISGITPVFFNGTINNITSLMDTNQYNGSNPNYTANLTTDSNGNRYSGLRQKSRYI